MRYRGRRAPISSPQSYHALPPGVPSRRRSKFLHFCAPGTSISAKNSRFFNFCATGKATGGIVLRIFVGKALRIAHSAGYRRLSVCISPGHSVSQLSVTEKGPILSLRRAVLAAQKLKKLHFLVGIGCTSSRPAKCDSWRFVRHELGLGATPFCGPHWLPAALLVCDESRARYSEQCDRRFWCCSGGAWFASSRLLQCALVSCCGRRPGKAVRCNRFREACENPTRRSLERSPFGKSGRASCDGHSPRMSRTLGCKAHRGQAPCAAKPDGSYWDAGCTRLNAAKSGAYSERTSCQ